MTRYPITNPMRAALSEPIRENPRGPLIRAVVFAQKPVGYTLAIRSRTVSR
jgi:hypothetical protein